MSRDSGFSGTYYVRCRNGECVGRYSDKPPQPAYQQPAYRQPAYQQPAAAPPRTDAVLMKRVLLQPDPQNEKIGHFKEKKATLLKTNPHGNVWREPAQEGREAYNQGAGLTVAPNRNRRFPNLVDPYPPY
jgi:hypothetical protein